jgi:hypothetical protein
MEARFFALFRFARFVLLHFNGRKVDGVHNQTTPPKITGFTLKQACYRAQVIPGTSINGVSTCATQVTSMKRTARSHEKSFSEVITGK